MALVKFSPEFWKYVIDASLAALPGQAPSPESPDQGLPPDGYNVPPAHGVRITGSPAGITALNPSTAPANADVTAIVAGTGFSDGATVNIGVAYSLAPASTRETDLSVVVAAANIAEPGVMPMSVENNDGQLAIRWISPSLRGDQI
jgi:hypothetical protein